MTESPLNSCSKCGLFYYTCKCPSNQMTDQKTPLKTKANTAWEIRKNVSVLSSDVKHLELEIQQLKNEHQKVMDNWKEYTDYQLRQKDGIIERLNETIQHQEDECIELEKQIETAKQILKEIEEKHPVPYRVCKFNRVKEVFGEKIET